jgi:hypothetical protein
MGLEVASSSARRQKVSPCSAGDPSQLYCPGSSKSDANAYAIFGQEVDTTLLETLFYRVQRGLSRTDSIVLDHAQTHGREACPVGEGWLGPFQQAARCADLGGADHGNTPYRKLEEI